MLPNLHWLTFLVDKMSTKPIPLTRSCPRCRNTGAYGYNATLSESEGQTSLCVKSLYATLHRYLVCT